MIIKRSNLLGICAACLGFTAPAAFAHNFDYHGFYSGVNAGYGSSSFDTSSTLTQINTTQGTSGDIDVDGWDAGVHFGYNAIVTQTFLLGLELGAEINNTRGSKRHDFPIVGTFVDTYTFSVKKENALSLALRLGTFPYEDLLAYIGVGVERGGWKGHFKQTTNLTFDPSVSKSEEQGLWGYLFTVGADMPFCGNWLAGIDWTYVNYNNSLGSGTLKGEPILALNRTRAHLAATYNTATTVDPVSSEFHFRISYQIGAL